MILDILFGVNCLKKFINEEKEIDFLDFINNCTEDEYDDLIPLENKIPFKNIKKHLNEYKYTKEVFVEEKIVKDIFFTNLLTYFPAYRYEQPNYLNDPYKINLNFTLNNDFNGYL